jgi:hypothetical protein
VAVGAKALGTVFQDGAQSLLFFVFNAQEPDPKSTAKYIDEDK